jgi:DNA-binding GntR family transcriptional regulator
VDGQVVGYELRYLPKRIGEALTQDEIHSQPMVRAVMRILGKTHTRLSLRVSSSVVRREEAKILETKVGTPVLVREHIWYVEPDGPVQYGKSIFRGDRYQMCLEFTSVPPVP